MVANNLRINIPLGFSGFKIENLMTAPGVTERNKIKITKIKPNPSIPLANAKLGQRGKNTSIIIVKIFLELSVKVFFSNRDF